MNNLINIIQQFKNKKIMVIGDVILDKYIWGEVYRISPEAPVQVVNVTKEEYVPGGASNVASNIAELGAQVYMVGVVGKDTTKTKLISEMRKKTIDNSYLIMDKDKRTTLKVRVFGRKQQLLRFDYEKKGDISKITEDKVLDAVKKIIKEVDAVIVSDYAKGVITRSIMKNLKQLCSEKKLLLIVDPKPEHKDYYKNVTLITPNHTEAHKMADIEENKQESDKEIEFLGAKLMNDLNSNILITRGEKGMSLFEKSGKITHIPTFAKEVYDIIGAGDTSVAALTLALSSNASLNEAAIIANYAAGITVGKIGTSTVSIEELKKSIKNG